MSISKKIKTFLSTFVRNEDGVTAIEYGLIAALIAVALVGALTALEGKLSDLFGTIGSNL